MVGETSDMVVPPKEALFTMTQDEDAVYVQSRKLNANTFPPLQKLMHHMMTTIIYPKEGSRNEVIDSHKFLFCWFSIIFH